KGGEEDGLSFEIQWEAPPAKPTAAEATRGRLAVSVGGRLVWGQRTAAGIKGIRWTWVDLLEHLAESWIQIQWEEGDPLGLDVPPSSLQMQAHRKWAFLPARIQEEQELVLYDYRQAHDLAQAAGGMDL